MSYNAKDVKRMFEAFNDHKAVGNTLEVHRLTQHLTCAPRPRTPIPKLYGSAHFSEIGSPGLTPQISEMGDSTISVGLGGKQSPGGAYLSPNTKLSASGGSKLPGIEEQEDAPVPAPPESASGGNPQDGITAKPPVAPHEAVA